MTIDNQAYSPGRVYPPAEAQADGDPGGYTFPEVAQRYLDASPPDRRRAFIAFMEQELSVRAARITQLKIKGLLR